MAEKNTRQGSGRLTKIERAPDSGDSQLAELLAGAVKENRQGRLRGVVLLKFVSGVDGDLKKSMVVSGWGVVEEAPTPSVFEMLGAIRVLETEFMEAHIDTSDSGA